MNATELSLDTPLLGTHVTWKQMLTNADVANNHQQAVYKDPTQVFFAMGLLREAPPLTTLKEINELKQELSLVAKGEAVIIQAGLCAEDMADKDAPTGFIDMMHGLSDIVSQETGKKVVLLGRIAGQLTKPRSESHETIDGKKVPTYRGEMVNGSDPEDREASPNRIMGAYTYSKMKATALRDENSKEGASRIYSSHEGLSFPYEYGLLQQYGDTVYAGSAPFIWIGDRTRQIDGPHIALAASVANPVGVKVNATTKPEELRKLIQKINPNKEPGKLLLIFRMGRDNIQKDLSPLLDVVKENKESVIAMSDGMHGNGKKDMTTGKKTRYVEDIKQEVAIFTKMCLEKGIHPGGIHIEASPDDVTECLGDNVHYLGTNYKTLCDPCLNPTQAGRVAKVYAEACKM